MSKANEQARRRAVRRPAGRRRRRAARDVNLEVILDVPVTLSMEVGRTRIPIRNLLQLNQGSVVELDRAAGEPLDVFVNGTLVAHGEVVVVNEKFGIRLTDVISPAERIRKLQMSRRIAFISVSVGLLAQRSRRRTREPTRPFAAPDAVEDRLAPAGVGSLGQVTLSLVLVLGAIFAAAWVVRRMRGFGRPGAGAIRSSRTLPLGTERARSADSSRARSSSCSALHRDASTRLHVLAEPVVRTMPSAARVRTSSLPRPHLRRDRTSSRF